MSLDRTFMARGGALLILAALLFALWLGPVGAYRALLGAGAQHLAAKEQLLDRYRALVESGAADRPADAKQLLLPALSEAEAAAFLQETLKAAASQSQVDIQGMQVLASEAMPGVQRIGVRLRGSGDMAGLDRLLYAIEQSRPLLYPDHLQIQSRALRPGLDFQFDVAGFKPGPA